MTQQKRSEATVLVLGIAVTVAILAGCLAAWTTYHMGYRLAQAEAQVELAKMEKQVSAAKTGQDSHKSRSKDKKGSEEVPLKVSSVEASALDVAGLSSLSTDQKTLVMKVLNNNIGPCEACTVQGLSAATCLLEKKICENMPRLAARVVRMVQQGKTEEEITDAVTYKEPWVRVDTDHAPKLGSPNAPVTIVEYSEFQCPFCARAQGTIKELKEKYGDKLRFAFMNYPISRHKQARPAALAALAADRQGKFWPFHDLLFERQKRLKEEQELFTEIATELHLNLAQWKTDMGDEALQEHIKKDTLQSRKVGVRGTPTFFINGYRLRGAQPTAFFERIIDLELEDLGVR